MSRDINDPRIAAIVRALDRAEECDSMVSVASSLVTLGHDVEHFERLEKPAWDSDAIRAVVLAYATRMPDEELSWLAERAEYEVEELDAMEAKERDEQQAAVQS